METEDDSGSPQPGTKVYRRFSGWGWPVMGFVMIFNAVEQFQVNYGRSADGVATRLHDIDWAVVSSLVGVVVGILFVIRPERVAALPEGLAMWGWFGRRRDIPWEAVEDVAATRLLWQRDLRVLVRRPDGRKRWVMLVLWWGSDGSERDALEAQVRHRVEPAAGRG
jgi:hypothetical protein